VRYYLTKQIGPQDAEDKLHEVFLIVVQAIRRGDLRGPDRLMGFVRTVVQRAVAGQIDRAVKKRTRETEIDPAIHTGPESFNLEKLALMKEQARIVKTALAALSQRDRELLERFYLLEQTPKQICAEMNLTQTQFRLYKSRAMGRFGTIGQTKVNPVRRFMAAISGG
jgi:RNA polymerase sigma-70 factor, ECF subfamily